MQRTANFAMPYYALKNIRPLKKRDCKANNLCKIGVTYTAPWLNFLPKVNINGFSMT